MCILYNTVKLQIVKLMFTFCNKKINKLYYNFNILINKYYIVPFYKIDIITLKILNNPITLFKSNLLQICMKQTNHDNKYCNK